MAISRRAVKGTPDPDPRRPATPAAPGAQPVANAEKESARESPASTVRPAGQRRSPPGSPRRPASGSRRPAVGQEPDSPEGSEGNDGEGSAGGEEAAAESPRRARGTEIGALRRRGMSLGSKVAIFTLLVTLLSTAIFGVISILVLQETLEQEIKHSGYTQVLTLNAFAQQVVKPLKGVRNPVEFQRVVSEYKSKPEYAAHNELLKRVVEQDPRILDVAIFASHEAGDEPKVPVLRTGNETNFRPPARQEAVSGWDPEVKIGWGAYGGKDVLFFRLPLEKEGDKMFSSASVIMEAEAIRQQVGSLKLQLGLIGLVLIGLGVGASLGLASRITRPIYSLVEDINIVSQGDLDHESAVHQKTSDELGMLAQAFNRMTAGLRGARDKERELERIEGELDTAKKIHFNLLPEKLPQLPGIDIANDYKSAKEVGGDYYDFIPVGDLEHLALTVADVSGKGIPGSMVMGTTRTILRMMAVNNLSAADVLAKTNFHVARDIKRGMFVTCVYAILNVRTREMTVASAGHNPMLIWRSATRTIEKVRPNGIALGFDKGPVFLRTVKEQKVKLLPGDRVVLYTDGVVEAMNEQREEWSDEALDKFTLENATLPSKEFVRQLIRVLTEWQGQAEQHDDITITTFRIV